MSDKRQLLSSRGLSVVARPALARTTPQRRRGNYSKHYQLLSDWNPSLNKHHTQGMKHRRRYVTQSSVEPLLRTSNFDLPSTQHTELVSTVRTSTSMLNAFHRDSTLVVCIQPVNSKTAKDRPTSLQSTQPLSPLLIQLLSAAPLVAGFHESVDLWRPPRGGCDGALFLISTLLLGLITLGGSFYGKVCR